MPPDSPSPRPGPGRSAARTASDGPPPVDPLARVRAARGRPEFDRAIGTTLSRIVRDAERAQLGAAAFADLWRAELGALAREGRLVSFRGGVATISVATSSARYEIGRALRAGAERRLRAAYPGTLRRIKVVVDAEDDARDGSRRSADG